MGKLKAFHYLNPAFAGKYKKLLEEELGSKDYSLLFLQEALQDYFSYVCRQCGHIQSLQAEDLQQILRFFLRLSYASCVQKSESSSFKEIIQSRAVPPSSHHSIAPPSIVCPYQHQSFCSCSVHTHLERVPCNCSCPTRVSLQTKVENGIRYTSSSLDFKYGGSVISEDSSLKLDDGNSPTSEAQSGINHGVLRPHDLSGESSSPKATSSLAYSPPPLPKRSDSLTHTQEPHLESAAWYQAGIPREIALEILANEPVGCFMVRESTSKPGCYALSLRVPRDFSISGIAHYLIVKTSKGFKIKGFTKEFSSLSSLVTHHSVMPELLPCPLSLRRYSPNCSNSHQEEDNYPDYNTLSDFRKVMADLNV